MRESAVTSVLYESPNRLLRTLKTIEEVFGKDQQVYVGLELTKKHESHTRGEVSAVFEQLESTFEGSRVKGEVTLVIGPYLNFD
jgi:16S rRNA (cytidine1402-2'-O)-methyltransferase